MSRVSDAVDRAGPRAVAGHGSMVATDHPIATDAAIECLREGGSATDAAVRAALVLAAVHPAVGLGGDAFAMVWDREQGLAGLRGSGDRGVPASIRAYADLVHRFGRVAFSDHLRAAAEIGGESRVRGTLRALADRGADDLYGGELASVVASSSSLSLEQLAQHRSEWVAPIECVYRGYSIYGLAPSAVVALEALALLDDWAIPDLPPDGREHIQIEAGKTASADTGMHPPGELLAEPHLELRRAELGPRARTDVELRPVALDSVHVSAIDAAGQWCSLGLSAPARGVDVAATGIVVGDGAATAAPCVGMISRAGLPWVAIGGALPNDVYSQILTRIIDFHATPEEALRIPRRRWLGGARVCFEDGFDAEVIAALEGRGHVRVREPADFGAAQIVAIDRNTHSLIGASDPRRGGKIGVA